MPATSEVKLLITSCDRVSGSQEVLPEIPRSPVYDAQQERWLPAVGFDGWYDVSNLGRVRRRRAGRGTHDGRILKPTVTKRGYLRISLNTGEHRKVRKNALVHVLVAIAFHGPAPSPRHEVNHCDGVKTNAVASNLEWLTRPQNIQHAYRTGLHRGPGKTPYWNPDDLPWDPAVHGPNAGGARRVDRLALAVAIVKAAGVAT